MGGSSDVRAVNPSEIGADEEGLVPVVYLVFDWLPAQLICIKHWLPVDHMNFN
jgi:hypothetical protein